MCFIADEAEKIIPLVVNKSNGYYSTDYSPVTALLVDGMQQQQKTIDTQNEKISRLEKHVEEMISVMERSGLKYGKRQLALGSWQIQIYCSSCEP